MSINNTTVHKNKSSIALEEKNTCSFKVDRLTVKYVQIRTCKMWLLQLTYGWKSDVIKCINHHKQIFPGRLLNVTNILFKSQGLKK